MNVKEKILGAIAANKPPFTDLTAIDIQQVTNYDNVVEKFTATLESIGVEVLELRNMEGLASLIDNDREEGLFVLNAIDGSTSEINEAQSATILQSVDKAYMNASLGVAENGAVWVKESQMINRLLPFICQHLVVVLEKSKVVSTMHHAYRQINGFEEGFAVFIAGPSKTADIEQSLVIGAHGARRMTVCLLPRSS